MIDLRLRHVLLAGVVAAGGGVASANESITYSYDGKGRLVKVERSGTVNNGVTAEYRHDKASNRTSLTVSGSPNTQ